MMTKKIKTNYVLYTKEASKAQTNQFPTYIVHFLYTVIQTLFQSVKIILEAGH